jgi:WD40 repeat protein
VVVETTTAMPTNADAIELDQEPAQAGYPYRVEVSPDGSQVVVFSSEPNMVRVYDIGSGEQVRAFENQDLHWAHGEALSSDWSLVAMVDSEGNGWVRDFESFEPRSAQLPDCTTPKAFSPDGLLLVLSGGDDPECRGRVVEWASGSEVLDLGGRYIHDAVFNPSGAEAGRYLTIVANPSADSETTVSEIYDMSSRTLMSDIGLDQGVRLALDPTGKYLAMANLDGTALVLDFEALVSGAQLEEATVQKLSAHDEIVIDIAMNGDGLLGTSSPGSDRLWDIQTGEMLADQTLDPDFWTFLAFTPKGDLLYTSSKSEVSTLAPE